MASSSSSSPSSSRSRSWKYDVFLSFRGEDTRKTFVDHLYSALVERTIRTYKDDVKLSRGDTIGPCLMNAIETSKILVIIFSENYADSSWCLDELTHIIKCRDSESGQLVIPIFYHVDPSDVRKLKRKYGEAFAKHELSENNKNKVESWKKALVDASKYAGWKTKGHEARWIQKIVASILNILSSLDSTSLDSTVEDENLVGIGTRLQQLRSHLRIGSGGVRMVGIWGVGGGGKTTLATSLYMEFFADFDGCCYVENIREESRLHGLKSLQEKILSTVFDKQMQVESVDIGKHKIKQMLCRRNVLIVLDDVDHLEQLEALAGYHNWFGNGSRIIITTRDEQVLKSHRVEEVCPVSLLSHDEAIRLFKRHAYQEHNPVEDYEKLSLRVISYANGLPLALKILGAFLYGKDKYEWLSTLDRLKYHPEMDIVQKLKISYDGLKLVEKELFLDIACFFRRERKDKAMEILDACGFHPRIGVKVLIQKALITVSKDGRFDMHDLVQEMGHYIVRGEYSNNPEKYSRVWREEDIKDMCSMNATTENDKIEAIQCYVQGYVNGFPSDFMMLVSNMKKLRFLKVNTWLVNGEPNFLSNELRYMEWNGYSDSPFPESFQPTKLVVLKMERSWQKELWKGYKYLPGLIKIELSNMEALVRTPDLGGLHCLQKLIIFGCKSLKKIHQSLGNHSSLVHIYVRGCKKLKRFPSFVRMEKLKILEISECEALIELPKIEFHVGMNKLEILRVSSCVALVEFSKIEANMDNLVTLSLVNVGIEILPSTIGEYCTNLTLLRLKDCSKLKSIDGNFHALKGLKNFELKGCKLFEKLPKDLFNENLGGLGLKLDSSSIKQLIPSSVPCFLTELDLSWCQLKDGDIPNEIGEISNLQELHLWGNHFTRLDFNLLRLTRLKLLHLSNCKNLVELPELPSSLAILKANWCESLEVIKYDAHKKCKWLCAVSIKGHRKNMTGGERLLESMLQGKAVKSRCMVLQLKGLEIPRGFEPRLVRWGRCRMQVPENWYNHFSGFLFCVVLSNDRYEMQKITTRMKHEKLSDSMRMRDYQDYVYWKETDNDKYTCMIYISFGLLRNTLWWDQTSTAIQLEIESFYGGYRVSGCGYKLIPKISETTITDSSFDDVSDDYTCRLKILHDSKSAFKFYVDYSHHPNLNVQLTKTFKMVLKCGHLK